ncbi:MAG: DUF6232 family protein [Rivularia sp. ALOHA_DT_140]|nr:DUF6232 family protein [Rivularia sp. ALOHA_DT_140]
MSVSALSKDSKSIVLERNKVITITNRTVRFGAEVYQTHNIAGFGEGEVEIGKIPWIALIFVFVVGSVLAVMGSFNAALVGLGNLLAIASFAGLMWNLLKPKHYGFLITLNSGDKRLFSTIDKPGLRHVTSTIYDILERNKEATYQVTVNNSSIKGNFIQGQAEGNLSYSEN